MPEETLKPTREYRIEMAKRYAPQNATQEREGLAIGELVTVNADMIKLLQEDMEAWKVKAEALLEIERLAREVDECYRLMGKIPADQPNLGVRGLLTLQKALSAQSDHFAEQDKGKTE